MSDQILGTIVHAADLHLGAPLESLGSRLDETHATQLRKLAASAFDRLVEATITEGAAGLVLAGDVYDRAEREVRSQFRFADGLQRLDEAGIRVFIAHGNHDPLVQELRSARALPDSTVVFAPGSPQVHRVVTSAVDFEVAGVSFAQQHETENLALRFHDLPNEGAHHRIGVLHANVGSNPGHDPYAPCSADDLHAAPIGYWALGHIHVREVRDLGPNRWYAYSGNLQGRSMKPAECGPKGALAVDLIPSGFAAPRFIPCDAIRFVRFDDLDVTDASDLGACADVVEEVLSDARDDGRPSLVRVRLTGATEAHAAITEEADALLERLQEVCAPLLAGGAVLKLDVATRPAIDRSRLLDRQDLVSELLVRLDAVRSEPDLSAQVIAAVDRPGARKDVVKALRAVLKERPDLAGEIVDRTERLLIDRLVEA